MSTPQQNFETATDEDGDREARANAIDQLEAANECDKLAELASDSGLDEALREQAVAGLAHPQCEQALRSLLEDGDLGSLRERAETLLEETPDDAGAGPN